MKVIKNEEKLPKTLPSVSIEGKRRIREVYEGIYIFICFFKGINKL